MKIILVIVVSVNVLFSFYNWGIYAYNASQSSHNSNLLDNSYKKNNTLVTIDAANGWGSDKVDRTISTNVKKNLNYYQNNPRLPLNSEGAANKGTEEFQVENNDLSKTTYEGSQMNHTNIDDATLNDVYKAIKTTLVPNNTNNNSTTDKKESKPSTTE